jgi:hypothetical protein
MSTQCYKLLLLWLEVKLIPKHKNRL